LKPTDFLGAPPAAGRGALFERRVLVIEDEYFIADEIREFLADQGAEILGPVADMENGLHLLEQGIVHCAVLDINLGGQSVFPLARALRAREVPWIYVTGYELPRIPEGLQGEAYLEKPVNKMALIRALERLV
jgi:DNA-binding response OmpR family regulator